MPPSAGEALAQPTCRAAQASSRPLLVEWPAADRAMLEAASTSGLVAVRYDGCELEVLSRCPVQGTYAYQATTHKRDEVRIRDADALWTELPLGAARLEAALSREGQLNVDMAVVGRLETDVSSIETPPGAASCARATHLITGITVGAFAMYTGAALEVRGDASVGNAGAGGELTRSREVLRQDGDFASCESDGPMSRGVPSQCGALLRVELAEIRADGTLGALGGPSSTERSADRLEQDADQLSTRWRAAGAGAGIAAAGSVAALGVAGVRILQIDSLSSDIDRARIGTLDADDMAEIERLESRRDGFKRDQNIALGFGVGLALGFGALVATASILRGKEDKLRERAQKGREQATVAPAFGKSFAGLSVSGRF